MTSIIKSGILLILIGFALILIGAVLSASNVTFGGLIMIGPIPIAFGSSPGITVVAMIIGLLLITSGMIRSARESEEMDAENETGEKKVKGGGVILIGPIPIVFGTDKKYALILMVVAIVLMLLAIIFLK